MSAVEALRAQIAATANPRPAPLVGVKGWEGVHVRPLTVDEIETPPEGLSDKQRTAWGLARTLCDADGNLIFDGQNQEHLQILGRQSATVLRKINEAAESLNVTTETAARELGNG